MVSVFITMIDQCFDLAGVGLMIEQRMPMLAETPMILNTCCL